MAAISEVNSDNEGDQPAWRMKVDKIREFLTPLTTEETESTSRREFLKRLETYKPGMWTAKPVTPPECARYGWVLVRESMLHCTTCGEYLCADLPSPSKLTSYKFSCEKLQEKIVTSHGKYCSWPSSPDADSVLGLPPLSNNALAKLVIERAASVEDKHSDKLRFSFSGFSDVGSGFFDWISEKFTINVSPDVVKLVLTGWQMDGAGKLVCTYCSRSWFPETEQTTEKDEPSEEVDNAPDAKKRRIESSESIEPLLQHQAWCAWRHAELGWTVYFNQLTRWRAAEQTETGLMQGRNISESLRRVRQMLQTTQSSV